MIGYYFIKGGNVDFAKDTRTGRYDDINEYFVNDIDYTNTSFKMGINHGQNAIMIVMNMLSYQEVVKLTLKTSQKIIQLKQFVMILMFKQLKIVQMVYLQ